MIAHLLPHGSGRRSAAVSGGVFVLTVLLCRVALPEGAPDGVLLQGAVQGARSALIAAGLILVYRSTRIINFAQAVMGAVGAGLMFNLGAIGIAGIGRAPFLLALVAGLLVAALIGALTELLFVRRFFNSPRLVLTVVTVVLAPTLAQLRAFVDAAPVWERSTELLERRARQDYPAPFPDVKLELFPFTFRFPELLTLVLAVAVFAGLGLFLRRSRLGASVRGVADNADRARLLGINVGMVSTGVWALAGLLSGLAASLTVASGVGGATGDPSEPEFLLAPLAAVVLGRLVSMPVTVLAAVGLGIVRTAVLWSYPTTRAYELLVLAIVLGGLFLYRNTYSRVDASAAGWKATEEIRPTPRELLALPGVRRLRRLLLVLVVLLVLVFPQAYSTAQAAQASLVAIYAVIALSMVILTGWGGQISLGQFALVAVGAIAGGRLTGHLGVPFWVALPLAAAVTAAFATVVGLPALRVRGPFLAVATLAFATAVHALLESGALDAVVPTDIERPTLLFVSFASERAYYYLCVAVVVAAAVVVRRLRASRPGRVLIAIREDEHGVQPFGIDAARTRLAVFALSGTLAGVAGVLLAHHSRAVEATTFEASASVQMFIMAMIGGVTSVGGALMGATYLGLAQFVVADPKVQELATSGPLLVLLLVAPGGLASLAATARDSVLRLVALRRRIVVPSLFADVDQEAVLNQKATFGPLVEGRGIDALPDGSRWDLPSELYADGGRRPLAAAPGGAP